MRILPFSILLLASLSLLACRTTESKDSDLRHEFGKTSKDDQRVFKPCVQVQDDYSLYLRDLAIYIAKANPETFIGEKSIDKFCFTVIGGRNRGNAYLESRRVEINRAWLWAAANDAEVAFILAHEIAHVLMGRGDPNNSKAVEQEADEVGFELSLRAQFSVESSRNAILKNIEDYEGEKALQQCLENTKRGIVPEIGDDSHALWCYRLYNIDFLEKKAHLQDYAALKEKAVLTDAPGLTGRFKAIHDRLDLEFLRRTRKP